MIQLFNLILFQPLLNLLVFFYNIVPGHDLGIAIILLTILIKLILYPLASKSIKSQKAMQDLQPKVEAVKKQYKDDKEKQAKALMDLYKNEKVNPLSSCLPLLIQLPFLIAVYQVFRVGVSASNLEFLYPFINNPGHLNQVAFGFFDLAKSSWVLAVITGLAQYWQSKMFVTARPPQKLPGSKDEDMMAVMNKQMIVLMPVMTVFIGLSLPAGLILYWLVMTLLTGAQQQILMKKKKPGEPPVKKQLPSSI
jgi:YidC/Oxa1 family membrane protein insertase